MFPYLNSKSAHWPPPDQLLLWRFACLPACSTGQCWGRIAPCWCAFDCRRSLQQRRSCLSTSTHGETKRMNKPVLLQFEGRVRTITSERRRTGESSAHIHCSDGVPNAVLVCCVIKALHRAEARPAVVSSDHIDPIVEGHRSNVTPFPRNILLNNLNPKSASLGKKRF